MTPARPRRTSSGAPAPGVPQQFLRALASALGSGRSETDRATATALRSLLRGAGEALEAITPHSEPTSPTLAKPVERPGLTPTRRALQRLTAAARSPGLGALADLYPAPAALAEDIFLTRCLNRDPAAALEVAAMRDLLSGATIPERLSDLAMDRALGLEQVSFATLWAEPHRLDSMSATFDYFRRRFRDALLDHHRDYWRAMRGLRLSLDDSQTTANALARLNSLEHLGGPLGEESLAQHRHLLGAVRDCPLIDGLEEALGMDSSCPACGLTLAAQPPSADVDTVLRRLSRALSQQMTRLSSEAVRQTLARARGRRIEQFVQAVDAGDPARLASVLDDELLEFLRDLLAEQPATAAPPVLERLSRAYPVIGEDEVEAATSEFRRLLEQALSQQRRARPGRAPTVRLELPGRPAPLDSADAGQAGR